jgi:hypothetical protein
MTGARFSINNQQSKHFSRSPSSSNKTRTAHTSACSGSRAVSRNNSGSTALGRVESHSDRPVSIPPHGCVDSRPPAIAVHSCPPTVLLSHRQRKCDSRYSMQGKFPSSFMPRDRLRLRWSGSRTRPPAAMRLNAATLECISRAPESARHLICGSPPKTVPAPSRDPRNARFGSSPSADPNIPHHPIGEEAVPPASVRMPLRGLRA